MAELYSKNFNNGGTDWTFDEGTFYHIGQDHTRCLSCTGNSTGQVRQDMVVVTTQGTRAFQFASIPGSYAGEALLTPGGPYSAGAGLNLDSVDGSTGSSSEFQIVLYVNYNSSSTVDGQLVFRIARGGVLGALGGCGAAPLSNPWFFASSTITNLNDGNWKGIQYNWSIDFGTQILTFQCLVDNVEVSSFSTTVVGDNGVPGGGCVLVNLTNTGLRHSWCYQIGPTLDELHFITENDYLYDTVEVLDWVGITDGPQLTPTSCDTPTYISTATDMDINCNDGIITVTGENFGPDIVLTSLEGPNGVTYTGDLTRISDTELTISNLVPDFVNGTYCITVDNPFP